jgi:uncharacterized PurR-regulated membrane protein YhhQ (DUF165 family)
MTGHRSTVMTRQANIGTERYARLAIGATAFALFAAMIVLSNYLLQHFGLLTLPLTHWGVPAGTACAAITWPTRDILSRVSGPTWGPWVGLAAVGVGAGIAWIISPTLAVASAVAYLCSEGTDWGLFWALGGQTREGFGYVPAVAMSTMVAAVVDSIVFLNLVGIPWSSAGPGLLTVKFAVVILALPVTYRLRDIVPVARPVPA